MLNIKTIQKKFNFDSPNKDLLDSIKLKTKVVDVHLFSHLFQLWKLNYDISSKVVILDGDEFLRAFFESEEIKLANKFISDLLLKESITFIISDFKIDSLKDHFLFQNNFLSDNSSNYFVFKSGLKTEELLSTLISYIKRKNAPIERLHGSLMSIFGEGVIIKGQSGIGKSELVLNLLNKNHLFVADDALDVIEYSGELYGKASPMIKNFLEIRGIGIIDIKKALGIQLIINSTKISLIIELKYLEEIKTEVERLGDDEKYTRIHNQNIPTIIIPVSQGRDLSSIVEMAVVVHKMKKYDKYNFLEIFNQAKKDLVEE